MEQSGTPSALRLTTTEQNGTPAALKLTTTEQSCGPATFKLRAIILDDDPVHAAMLSSVLSELGCECAFLFNLEGVAAMVDAGQCQVVLADVEETGKGAFKFIERLLEGDPRVEVLLMTSSYTLEKAQEAVRRGARDLLVKPVEKSRLQHALCELRKVREMRSRVSTLDHELLKHSEFLGMAGKSSVMLDVFDFVRTVSGHATDVLLVGQAGTGKELLARAIHSSGLGREYPFTVCNCSLRHDRVVQGELFGSVSGSFPGDSGNYLGLLEYCDRGTVFLDEVDGLGAGTQERLSDFLRTREIQRPGSREKRGIPVRIIAATRHDLHAEVRAGRFCRELFEHLALVQKTVPALSERREDIPLLVRFFLNKYGATYGKNISGLTRRAQAVLSQHVWIENVRELENAISSAVIAVTRDFIDIGDLPHKFQSVAFPADAAGNDLSLKEVRRRHIRSVVERCGGNRPRAARILGIGRTSLYRYLKPDGSGGRKPAESAGAVA